MLRPYCALSKRIIWDLIFMQSPNPPSSPVPAPYATSLLPPDRANKATAPHSDTLLLLTL
jgi:hypothetical protein